jgi:hypothetical protein
VWLAFKVTYSLEELQSKFKSTEHKKQAASEEAVALQKRSDQKLNGK